MICDEAQKIKNPNALVTRAAKKQNARLKIACTGTPVKNKLTDIWCLFDFVQPDLLGALKEFGNRYRRPIEADKGCDYEYEGELGEFGEKFHYDTRGTGGMMHNDPDNRSAAVFGGSVTLHAGGGREAYVLLPVIPAKDGI